MHTHTPGHCRGCEVGGGVVKSCPGLCSCQLLIALSSKSSAPGRIRLQLQSCLVTSRYQQIIAMVTGEKK